MFLATCLSIPGKVGLSRSCMFFGQFLYFWSFSRSFKNCIKENEIHLHVHDFYRDMKYIHVAVCLNVTLIIMGIYYT